MWINYSIYINPQTLETQINEGGAKHRLHLFVFPRQELVLNFSYSNPKSFVASASLSQHGLMAERSRSLSQLISDCYMLSYLFP
jgi:hypothetical protein